MDEASMQVEAALAEDDESEPDPESICACCRQRDFWLDIRSQVQALGRACEYFPIGWNNIQPKPTWPMDVEDFCLRSVVLFVPHMIRTGYVPYCPHCESAEHVATGDWRWTNTPMVIHGVSDYCLLDTVRYKCTACDKTFMATNRKSVMLADDRGDWPLSKLPFHLLNRCAIDKELHNYLDARQRDPIHRIWKELNTAARQRHVDKVCEFYTYWLGEDTTTQRSDGLETLARDSRQSMHCSFFAAPGTGNANGGRTARQDKELRKLMSLENQAKLRFEGAEQILKSDDSWDIDNFIKRKLTLQKKKSSGNHLIFPMSALKSMNQGKLEPLARMFGSFRSFLDAHNSGQWTEEQRHGLFGSLQGRKLREKQATVKDWATRVSELFRAREAAFGSLKADYEAKRQARVQLEAALSSVDGSPTVILPAAHPALAPAPVAPQFSDFDTSDGYCGKVISQHLIKQVLHEIFSKRKSLLQAKLAEMGAEVASIDNCFKLGQKVCVHLPKGTVIKPFTGFVSVMNERNEVIWWGMIRNNESMADLKPFLLQLKARFERLGTQLKVIYVDNCCTVRNILQEVFPNVAVRLDPFHWIVRWEPGFVDPKSKESHHYRVFISLITRALLVVPEAEFNVKKELLCQKRLEKKQRMPSVAQILKTCDKVVPQPDVLEEAILAVVQYVLAAELERATVIASIPENDTTTRRPRKIVKSIDSFLALVQQQLTHVRKGCLSDVPGVSLVSSKGKVSRGTNKNERLNRFVEREFILSGPTGMGRAEAVIWKSLESWNQTASETRGGGKHQPARTESMAMANSLALQAGAPIPFPEASMPVEAKKSEGELMGFDLFARDEALLLGDYACLSPNVNDEGDASVSADSNGGDDDEEDDVEFDEEVENEVKLFRRLTMQGKAADRTSMGDFRRVSGGSAWTPFNVDGDDIISTEERRLFSELERNYSVSAPVNANNGYGSFERRWNAEAFLRHRKRINNVEGVLLIYSKSRQQLKDYYNQKRSLEGAGALITPWMETQLHHTQSTLKRARTHVQLQPRFPAVPRVYATGPSHLVPPGIPFGFHDTMLTTGFSPQPLPGNVAPFLKQVTPVTELTARPKRGKVNGLTHCRECLCPRKDYHTSEINTEGKRVFYIHAKCPKLRCGVCMKGWYDTYYHSHGAGFACRAYDGRSFGYSD